MIVTCCLQQICFDNYHRTDPFQVKQHIQTCKTINQSINQSINKQVRKKQRGQVLGPSNVLIHPISLHLTKLPTNALKICMTGMSLIILITTSHI